MNITPFSHWIHTLFLSENRLAHLKAVQSLETFGDNAVKLLVRVGLKDKAGEAETAGHALMQQALRQIHGVGDGKHGEARSWSLRPIEKVVKYLLTPRAEQIELWKGTTIGINVFYDYTDCTETT